MPSDVQLAPPSLLVETTPPEEDETNSVLVKVGGVVDPSETGLPQRCGPYLLGELLGSGGMGAVYRVQDPQQGERVAVKLLLLPDDEAGASARRRFARESRVLRGLRHPGIVPVREAGNQGAFPYLVMDYVEGGSLEQRLEDLGPLPPREAAALVAESSEAVAYAHGRGVLHRDLKPANVLLRDGRPLLADFGLAKVLPEGELVSSTDHALTSTGRMMGTPGYWAPELAASDGAPPGPRTDVFGLGAILYAALTGRPPFTGRDLRAVIVATLCCEAIAPSALREAVPRSLDRICLRALALERAARYPSAQALGDALRAWAQPRQVPRWVRGAAGVELAAKLARRLSR